jgi:enoyl-CoA hydratase
MSDVLLIEDADGVATLTMNRPEAMNALSRPLRHALVAAFRELARDLRIGAVVLTGAGRAFSAGVDLKELGGESGGAADAGDAVTGADIVGAMHDCPKPIVGAINGFAITGGFEIALACDVLVASRSARFADTHARVGILPGWGLSQKLPRLVGIYRAKELSLTGNFLPAETAEAWGLVNRVVEPEELLPVARGLARDMLSCDRETMLAYKALIDEGFGLPFRDALALERQASRDHFENVTPERVAERRRAIQERGRRQG